MIPLPRPSFTNPHALRMMRDRALAAIWQRCRPHLAFLLAIALAFLVCRFGLASEGRWVVAEVTAYCPCALCCGTEDRTTANNTNTDRVPYAFAADRSLAFGTRIYVPAGLGVLDQIRAADRWFPVDDRGGALDTEARKYGVTRLDLRVRDHWWAVRFGRRSLPVFITTN